MEPAMLKFSYGAYLCILDALDSRVSWNFTVIIASFSSLLLVAFLPL